MSMLRSWMVLGAAAFFIVAILFVGFFSFIGPAQKAIASARQREQQAQASKLTDEALQEQIQAAKMEKAENVKKADSAKEEFEWFINNKMPYVARNEWWRFIRLGHGLSVEPFSTRYGPSNTPVVIEEGRGLMLDMWFELREDLGPLVHDYFAASGCQIGPFSLPAPQMAPYGSAPVTIPISLSVTGEYTKVLSLMRKLGDFPRLIAISSFALTPVSGTNGRIVQTTLPATIYILPRVEPSQLTAAAAAAVAPAAGAMPGMPGMPGMMGPGAPMMGPPSAVGGAAGGPAGKAEKAGKAGKAGKEEEE